MKECKKCGHKKTWNGDDISCPFQTDSEFGDNWNCGIIGEIRDICEAAMNGEDHRLHYQYCEDQKYVVINTDCIQWDDYSDNPEPLGLCLWVTWYKSRGRTDQMWLLNSHGQPVKPTFEQLQIVVSYYKKQGVIK